MRVVYCSSSCSVVRRVIFVVLSSTRNYDFVAVKLVERTRGSIPRKVSLYNSEDLINCRMLLRRSLIARFHGGIVAISEDQYVPHEIVIN